MRRRRSSVGYTEIERCATLHSLEIRVVWSSSFTDDHWCSMADPNPTRVAYDCTALGTSHDASYLVPLDLIRRTRRSPETSICGRILVSQSVCHSRGNAL